ncbi:MAG: Benzoate--CoA ligase [uncultured Rubrobacteraceae bacterium]|uniref:Benzoate--CoA ligase n=1 Tax=uncultured Rubrobacteraceae bacterium TaxID=349277 RepID=A0A6J4RAR1_9ACTN|nr:MAG: Benzoate--CoA ligase [uncultured Rubrobacteraceae bacterium]
MISVPDWYNASLIVDRNLEAGRAEGVAIFYGDEQVTYGELARRINRLGHALKGLGVRQEERVLLVLNDTPSFPTAFFAAIRIGAVPIPVNTLLKAEDYRYFVENSRARAVVTDLQHYEKVRAGLEGYDEPVELILTNGRVEGEQILEDLLEAGDDELAPASTHKDDPAFWLYSSGSTGKPKGTVHLQHDINYTCETYARHVLEITESDRVYSASNLFHAYGLGNGISFPYWAGASTVLYSGRPTPQVVLENIQRYKPTLFFSVPTLYNAILNYENATDYDLSSIRQCASAAEALPAGMWRRWKETFGSTILDGIGSTEMLHIFISNTLDGLKPGSSGRPVPGYKARILNDEGYPVEPGEAGYLSVKGDSAAAYYWRNHEKTKATMQGEWLFAGDWYRMDEDGYYWYEGRSDDMIKVSGLWVSPVEVESTLMDHPAVIEAAAVGIPVGGLTRVKANIILREGYEGSDNLTEELQTWCKDRLKRYQYPHLVEFVDELPKTVTGKIQRFKLRQPEPEVEMPRQKDELV